MDFEVLVNARIIFLVALMIIGSMNAKSLAATVVAAVGIVESVSIDQMWLVIVAYVVTVVLSQFRE